MARARSRYAPDRGLTGRMVTTMFLIGLLYVVFVGVLLAALRGSWPIILIITGGLFIAQFWFSDRIAAYGMGARESPRTGPRAARHHRPHLRARRHAEAQGGHRRE